MSRWLAVELRHPAALRAVADEGSFRVAAQRLGYAQSAVSQQIAFLERVAGVRLIERTRGMGSARVTAAGRLVLDHADEVHGQIEDARNELRRLATGDAGSVRVGAFHGGVSGPVARALARYSERWPGVSVSVVERPTDAPLFDLVRDATLDLAFANLPLLDGPFAFRPLLDDPWMLVVPSDSPLAQHPRLGSLEKLAGLRLIGRRDDRTLARIEARLQASGACGEIVYRSDVAGTVQALVAARLGAAIIPRLAIDPGEPRTAAISLDGLLERRGVAVFWHRERVLAPAHRNFVTTAEDVCAEAS